MFLFSIIFLLSNGKHSTKEYPKYRKLLSFTKVKDRKDVQARYSKLGYSAQVERMHCSYCLKEIKRLEAAL
jgi:hypothetical protein